MQRDVPRVSLVLPVHNQGEHIRSIVEGYIDGLDVLPIRYEIILIVNGSTDDSQAVCDALAAEFDGVQALALEKRGWGHSVRTGLSVARGDLLCFTNSARTTREILMLTLAYSLAYPEVVAQGEPEDPREPAPKARLAALQHRVQGALRPLGLGHQRHAEDLPAHVRQAARL